jgi:hypothetical protein
VSACTTGTPLPPTELPVGTRASTGIQLDLREARPRLIAVMKAECPTCAVAAPVFERIAGRLAAGGFDAWLILQNTAEEAEPFLAEHHLDSAVALEPEPWEVSRALSIASTPTWLLTDDDAIVTHATEGFGKEDLQALLESTAAAAPHPVDTSPLFTADDGLPDFKPG